MSLVALILLGAVGCSDDEKPATLDLQGNWHLVAATYEGHQYDFTRSTSPPPGVFPQANLVLTGWGMAQANTGCRTASVVLQVRGQDVSVAVAGVGSMMSCLPGTVDPMQGTYYRALRDVEGGSISGDELSLSGPDTTLTFRRGRSKDG